MQDKKDKDKEHEQLFGLCIFGVHFPPTQARSIRLLLELSLSTPIPTSGFHADVCPDQGLPEEKC